MNNRYKLFLISTIGFILLWAFHLFVVQVADPHNLQDQIALRQNPSKKILYPNRGHILTRDNELLVGSIVHYQVDIDLNNVRNYSKRNNKNYDAVIDSISVIISNNTTIRRREIKRRLNSKSSSIYIDNKIPERDLMKLKSEFKRLHIPGLTSTFSQIDRTYPKGNLAARLLGMTGLPKKDINGISQKSLSILEGKCGLEKSFNEELTGSYGWKQSIYDAKNKRIPIVNLKEKPAVDGNSIILTMDMEIQEILEENLRSGLKKYKAKNAIGIIMNPETAEIIAISGISAEDKNYALKSLRGFSNMAVSFMFEPGSVMKPITALLALEENVFAPDELITTKDYIIKYSNKTRKIKDDHKFKALTLKDVIAHSSNVGISKAVEKIGSKKLYERMIAMGFGQESSNNISNEASGILRKLKDWQGYSLHSISFGQEISVTALQLTNAYCTMANGGNVMRPYILKEIRNPQGKVVMESQPQRLRTISDKKSLDTLKVFLKSVVDYGTARNSKLSFVDIAGKTGTAEKKVLGESGYSKEKYISVFTGFFPVKNPKYVMTIVYDEADFKSYSYYGSNSAAPTFSNIAKQIIRLPESDILIDIVEDETDFISAPNLLGKNKSEVEKLLTKKKILRKYHGDLNGDIVINQFPKPGILYDKNENLMIVLGENKSEEKSNQALDYQMPNIIGKTLRMAMVETNKRGIKLIVSGNGIIASQSIAAGTQIKFGEKCRISAK